MSYATIEDYLAYLGVDQVEDEDEVERVLGRATSDIDSIVGAWPIQTATGTKFMNALGFITTLASWQQQKVKDATCAQAEYRLTQGEEFFIQAQYESVSGRFSVSGKLPYIGPKVVREFINTGIVKTSARIGNASGVSPAWVFGHETGDED